MQYTYDEKRALSNNMRNISAKINGLKKFIPQSLPLFKRLEYIHNEVKSFYDELNPSAPMQMKDNPSETIELTKKQWVDLLNDAKYEVYFSITQKELKEEYFHILEEISALFTE